MSTELRKKILEAYLDHTEKSSTTGLWSHEIAKELGLDGAEVKAECDYLIDDKFLEIETMNFNDGKEHHTGIRITSKGKTELQTTYNPEWVKQKNKEKDDEKKLRKREINSVESSHRWTKIGVIGAIVISSLSLIIAILKP